MYADKKPWYIFKFDNHENKEEYYKAAVSWGDTYKETYSQYNFLVIKKENIDISTYRETMQKNKDEYHCLLGTYKNNKYYAKLDLIGKYVYRDSRKVNNRNNPYYAGPSISSNYWSFQNNDKPKIPILYWKEPI